MPSPSASSRGTVLRFAALGVGCIGYAVVRYNVFAGVAWREAPLFVANKGLSLAAIILLAAAYLVHRVRLAAGESREERGSLARAAGLAGFGLALVHTAMSLLVFTESRYPRLVASGDLTLAGIVSLALGAVAIPLFAAPALYSFEGPARRFGASRWKRAQQVGYAGLAASSVHILAIGSANWFDPSRWPGELPPISLLSFLVCTAPLAVKAWTHLSDRTRPEPRLT